jgi:hypothetical protein
LPACGEGSQGLGGLPVCVCRRDGDSATGRKPGLAVPTPHSSPPKIQTRPTHITPPGAGPHAAQTLAHSLSRPPSARYCGSAAMLSPRAAAMAGSSAKTKRHCDSEPKLLHTKRSRSALRAARACLWDVARGWEGHARGWG